MEGLDQDTALLRDLASFADLSVAAIARKVNVAPSTLQRPYAGTATTRLSQRTIEKLRAAFPSFPGWRAGSAKAADEAASLGDRRLPFRDAGPARSETSEDTLAIPMLEMAYGMGGTFLDGIDPGATVEHFPRSFVRMFTSAPESKLCFAHGIGDSMYPTIGDRDVLLIDRSYDSVRINDQIWALAANGIGMVKRVRVETDGRVTLLADNDRVPDYAAAEDELTIIGRVVAVVKRT